ncbi:hypothetical protein PVAP13_2NG513903 [Panicum virgatum]|uniref:Uncharacterized protein n=1 Tax=Panicum virgatum TaxID=38727 RepID=A0A8T0VQY3_PANVG|nr:hypothetical protein PVAP13_2NG513903 [Panicum virgatum]
MPPDARAFPGQRPEGLPAAVAHVDVHVHAPRPEQRRVQAVLVVGGEDDDALLAAGRPQPVDEVEQPGQGERPNPTRCRCRSDLVVATTVSGTRRRLTIFPRHGGIAAAVDVLDDEDGPVGHADEQPLQRAVHVHAGEVEVEEVVAEVVGHGGDEAGLAGAGRAVEQEPALPGLADAAVVVPPAGEEVEIGDDGALELRVHGERVERGRMVVADPVPGPALVHADLELAVPLLHLLGGPHDEGHVPVHGDVRVLGVEAELQHEVAVAAGAGLAFPGLHLAPAAAGRLDAGPAELDALEDVDGGIPRLEEEDPPPAGAAVAVPGAGQREAQPAHGARVEPGGQVRPRGVEEEVLLAPAADASLLAPDDERAALPPAPSPRTPPPTPPWPAPSGTRPPPAFPPQRAPSSPLAACRRRRKRFLPCLPLLLLLAG